MSSNLSKIDFDFLCSGTCSTRSIEWGYLTPPIRAANLKGLENLPKNRSINLWLERHLYIGGKMIYTKFGETPAILAGITTQNVFSVFSPQQP